jgi:hypothetical protein
VSLQAMAKKKPTQKKTPARKKQAVPLPAELVKKGPTNCPQLHQILQWVVDGNDEHDVREAIADKFPGMDADAAIAEIVAYLSEAGQASGDVVRGYCLEAYRKLYSRMVSIGDFANAARVIKELSKFS